MKNKIENNKNYTVYMHISPSDKKYVGITRQNPKKRWNYGYGYIGNSYFYNAIQKYGWDNFQHEILFENLTKEEAEQKEIELIALYNTTNRSKGYNIENGGNCIGTHSEETINKMKQPRQKRRKEVFQYTRRGEFVKKYNGIVEASKELGISDGDISLCCKGTFKTAGGFIWRYTYEDLSQEYIEWCNSKECISVCQYSKDGVFIKRYYNVSTAANELNLVRRNIIECCNGERGLLGDYIWTYSDFELTEDYIKWCNEYQIRKNLRPVVQYSKDGKIVSEYCSIHEAERKTGASSQHIYACCNNNQKTTSGYIWRYKDDELTEEYLRWCNKKNSSGQKAIIQYNIDGNFISEWNSITKASSQLHIRKNHIIDCCKNKRESAGGFVWRYASDVQYPTSPLLLDNNKEINKNNKNENENNN